MLGSLDMPLHRRIAGAIFGILFFVIGFIFVAFAEKFPAGISGFDTQDTGAFLVLAGVITSPFIFYPSVFNRFPTWVHERFPLLEQFFRQLLCTSGKR